MHYKNWDWPSRQSLVPEKKEGTAPTAGRTQQHFAASSTHHTGANEEFCYGCG
jgi:hypothetical protein